MEYRKSPETLAVLVLGTDTLLEALPARPIQLAHACGALGFDLIVPLSWGDELVAEAALRQLEARSATPAAFCSCPMVRQRLLQAGTDLASVMLSLAPSPVALARHLRGTMGQRLGSLTFVGACPSAIPPDYDVSYSPSAFFEMLRAEGIQVQLQPDAYVDRLPADRRRHVSLPGGCPSPDALWHRCHEMTLIEVDGPDLILEVAQYLLSSQPVLIDLATSIGCHCAGVTSSTVGISARVAVTSLEPPRSITPVVNDAVVPDLGVPVAAGANSSHATSYGHALSPDDRPPMAVTPPAALTFRQ